MSDMDFSYQKILKYSLVHFFIIFHIYILCSLANSTMNPRNKLLSILDSVHPKILRANSGPLMQAFLKTLYLSTVSPSSKNIVAKSGPIKLQTYSVDTFGVMNTANLQCSLL